MPRRRRLISTSILSLALALAGIAAGVPAQASSVHSQGAAAARLGPPLIAPLPGLPVGSAIVPGKASATCVSYAARAGWPNNGYYSGDLVTAAAICVAESTGDPKLYVCNDANGNIVGQGDYVQGQPVNCPQPATKSYDRGLWQLNSKNASSVSDTCAFSPACDAWKAYLFSQRGTDFEPWSSYDQDTYAQFIDPVQTAVTKLTAGTVTSAELGECLVQSKSAVNAKVVIGNCGSGATNQQWSIAGGKLRSGSLCAAISPAAAGRGVVLQRCASKKSQDWAVHGRAELRNAADGKCLTDPNGSLTAGTAVTVAICANAKDQTWWLP